MGDFEAALSEVGRSVRDRIGDPATLESFRELVRSAGLTQLLRECIADESVLTALARQSQLHPNSFLKVPLAVTPGMGKLVIHEWFDEPSADPDLHNHRWNFVSTVLRGQLQATEFSAQADSGGAHAEFVYESATNQPAYPLSPFGRATLTPIGTRSVSAGGWYSQDHAIIHGAGSAMPGTITLIVQGAESSIDCRVFRPVGSSEAPQDVLRPEPEEVRATLEEVLRLLLTSSVST